MLPGMIPAGFATVGGAPDTFTKLLLHFDNNATDSSLSARGNGTPGGQYQYTTTKQFGTHAAYFATSPQSSLTFPNSTDFDFGAGDFTVDWWEYRLTGGASRPIFARDFPTTYTPFLIWSDASNVVFHSSTNGSSWNAASGVNIGSITTSSWHHFAIVRAGNTLYGFKDGALTGSYAFNFTLPAWGNPPYWGSALNGSFYNGYIDEFRWSKGIARWTAAFTPPTAPYTTAGAAPVAPELYTKLLLHGEGANNSVVFTDASPLLRGNATVYGNAKVSTAQFKFGSASILMDGAADALTYPTSSDWDFGTGDFTIDAWVRIAAYGATPQVIVCHPLNGTDFSTRWLLYVQTDGAVNFDGYISNVSQGMNIASAAGTIPVNTWKHVAIVRSGNTFTLYVDGVSAGTASTANAIPTITGELVIGALDKSPLDWTINGHIDELRISKGIARWTATFNVPAAPY